MVYTNIIGYLCDFSNQQSVFDLGFTNHPSQLYFTPKNQNKSI